MPWVDIWLSEASLNLRYSNCSCCCCKDSCSYSSLICLFSTSMVSSCNARRISNSVMRVSKSCMGVFHGCAQQSHHFTFTGRLITKNRPEAVFIRQLGINDDGCANNPRFSTVQLQRPKRLLQWHVLYRCRLLSIVSQQLPMQISHVQHPTLGCEPQRLPIR